MCLGVAKGTKKGAKAKRFDPLIQTKSLAWTYTDEPKQV